VFNTMKVLADGGGIYVTSNQGASYASGTLVRGNVIHDTITSYNFGLYTDYGAAWVTVQSNVVYRGDTPVVLHVSPPLENVAFIGNFWDADPDRHDQPPEKVTFGSNTRLPRDSFESALAAIPAGADIVAGAGLQPDWKMRFSRPVRTPKKGRAPFAVTKCASWRKRRGLRRLIRGKPRVQKREDAIPRTNASSVQL